MVFKPKPKTFKLNHTLPMTESQKIFFVPVKCDVIKESPTSSDPGATRQSPAACHD